MPQLEKLIHDAAALDPVEREKLWFALFEGISKTQPSMHQWLSWLSAEEHASIVATPTVCGGAARFIRTRIPVWTVVRMRELDISEADILRSYPNLRASDLVQAWSYAARNRSEIEQAIRENEEE